MSKPQPLLAAALALAVWTPLACQPDQPNASASSGSDATSSTTFTTQSTGTTTEGPTTQPTTSTSGEPTTGPASTTTGDETTETGDPTTGDPTTGQATTAAETDVDTSATTGDPEPFVLYLDPGGDDANSGLTPADALVTLARAQEILFDHAPQADVEIRIAQGTYLGQSVTWTYHHEDFRTSLMPSDYEVGDGINDIAGRPVFDGQGQAVLLTLDVGGGTTTNLEFIYLQVQHYLAYGLLFRGDRNDLASGYNRGNRVFGLMFRNIGSLHADGEKGYGALDLVNSRDNDIRNNHFIDIENDAQTAGLMHGVYLAHYSSGNDIAGNRFVDISGDPIRVRDGSDNNRIETNTFERTGVQAFYSDWYCDPELNPNCTKPGGECPSWENEFRDNTLKCGYDNADLSTFAYLVGAPDYVPPNCPNQFDNDWKRLYTSGNAVECP